MSKIVETNMKILTLVCIFVGLHIASANANPSGASSDLPTNPYWVTFSTYDPRLQPKGPLPEDVMFCQRFKETITANIDRFDKSSMFEGKKFSHITFMLPKNRALVLWADKSFHNDTQPASQRPKCIYFVGTGALERPDLGSFADNAKSAAIVAYPFDPKDFVGKDTPTD